METSEMVEVISSNIWRVGFKDNTLYVQFHKGNMYSLSPVSEQDFIALRDAPSVGAHYYANFRDNPSITTQKVN